MNKISNRYNISVNKCNDFLSHWRCTNYHKYTLTELYKMVTVDCDTNKRMEIRTIVETERIYKFYDEHPQTEIAHPEEHGLTTDSVAAFFDDFYCKVINLLTAQIDYVPGHMYELVGN